MTLTATSKILYVDDDHDDVFFLRESLSCFSSGAALVCSSNGEDAVEYLNSVPESELPDLIILDLNMPRWDGRQTLHYLKAHARFASIPVIILSTSENKTDMEACKKLGALSYLQKPNHFDGYREVVHSFLPFLNSSPS
jgi:CheY-like chemotaxis protein